MRPTAMNEQKARAAGRTADLRIEPGEVVNKASFYIESSRQNGMRDSASEPIGGGGGDLKGAAVFSSLLMGAGEGTSLDTVGKRRRSTASKALISSPSNGPSWCQLLAEPQRAVGVDSQERTTSRFHL